MRHFREPVVRPFHKALAGVFSVFGTGRKGGVGEGAAEEAMRSEEEAHLCGESGVAWTRKGGEERTAALWRYDTVDKRGNVESRSKNMPYHRTKAQAVW